MISEHAECALPKSESVWLDGVRMKDAASPSLKDLKQEIERWKRVLKEIPDANFGRFQELKDKIKKKTFLTKEAIEEASERLAERFLGKN